MMRVLGLFALLFAFSAQAESMPARHWNFTLDLWAADCKGLADGPLECGLPTRASPTRTLTLDTPEIENPGSAALARADFAEGSPDAPFAAHGHFAGRVSVFAVYPAESSGLPPYDQVRLEIWSPVRVTCYHSVRRQEPAEHSPLICSGFDAGGKLQAGVNLLLPSSR